MKRDISFDEALHIYREVSDQMNGLNSFVVEHSPFLSYITGSHNNAAHLGSSEQGKSAAFYLGPYFHKEKFGLQESLLVMKQAEKHMHQFASLAEDKGTIRRNTMFYLTHCLN